MELLLLVKHRIKVRVQINLSPEIRELANKRKINISQFTEDGLREYLGVPDDESEILKGIEELEQTKIALNLKLQDIKLKKGLSFDEFIDNIQNSDSYADKRKEAIISDLIDAMQTIKRNPAFVSGQQSRIYRKHDINIKPDQLRKWANEKPEVKL